MCSILHDSIIHASRLVFSVAACLLLQLSVTLTANKAIEILREHRGGGAIQTVKVKVLSESPVLLEIGDSW